MSEEEKKEVIDKQKEETILRTTKVLKVLFVVLAISVVIMLIYRLSAEKKKISDTTLYIMENSEKHVESLGKYKELTYVRQDTLVTDAQIDEKIQSYITQGIRYEKLDDRMGSLLEPGDIVNCTYVAVKDGNEIEKKHRDV